jgi:Zn-dependent peptidase ImmA (M78 family)
VADTRPVPSEHTHRGAKRARQAREQLGLGAGPLTDLLTTIERRAGAHVLVLALGADVAGAFIDRPGLPLLFVNGRDAPARQRFTLAHELGHLRMHHGSIVDRPEAVGGYGHDPVEVSANAFAAELLMPKVAVQAWGRERVARRLKLHDVVEFAWRSGVSAQAARFAFATAGVETDQACLDELDAAIAEEAHIALAHEMRLSPLDDELARIAGHLPRIPATLRDTALGDLVTGAIDVERFAARLGRPTQDALAMLRQLGIAELLQAA